MSNFLTDNLYLVFNHQSLFNGSMRFKVIFFVLFICGLHCTDVCFAGRRAFVQTQDTELLAAGDMELESWLWVKESVKNSPVGWISFTPVIGLTNNLEFSFPWEMNFTEAGTQIANLNLEAKYLLTDSISENPWRTALKVGLQKTFKHPKESKSNWQNLSLIQSYGNVKGSHWTLELGGFGNWANRGNYNYAVANLGYTYKISELYRLGLEYSGEYPVGAEDQKKDIHLVGPDFSYARGSTWLTIGYLFGLNDNSPSALYRLACGAIF